MQLRKYETFAAVVETGSLTRAAEKLGLTQSAVSHILRDLEEEFGMTLLLRGRQGIRLTAEGTRLLPAIQSVLDANRHLEEAARELRGSDAGVIRIAAFSSVAVHWLPSIFKGFRKEHPQVEFQLENGDYHDVEQCLEKEQCDIGFITLPTKLSCRTIPLCDDPLLAIVSKDHRRADASVFPVADAAGEDFISLLEASSHDTRRVFRAAGISPNVRFTTKDDYAIIAMVEQGLGVSIMPKLLLEGHTENVTVLPLDPPSHRTIALAFSRTGDASPLAAAFARYVQTYLAEQNA